MKTPRTISATKLIKAFKPFGYEITRQTGSHIRLKTDLNGKHHITIPNHNPIRVGTFSAIISDVAQHLGKTKQELLEELF